MRKEKRSLLGVWEQMANFVKLIVACVSFWQCSMIEIREKRSVSVFLGEVGVVGSSIKTL